jgi:hypothetical protein
VPVGVHRGALLVADVRGALQPVPMRGTALRAALLCAAGRVADAQPLLHGLRSDVQALIARYVAAASTASLQPPVLEPFRLAPRDRIMALMAARRYAEAVRLLGELPADTVQPLCRAVAVAAAAAGEESVAMGALDRLNALCVRSTDSCCDGVLMVGL